MKQQNKNTTLIYLKYIFFIGWSILVFTCYFPSLRKGDLTGLFEYFPYRFFTQCGLMDIFLACWVILITYGIGNFVLERLRLQSTRKNENVFLSFAFGFILISFSTLVLALLGLLYSFLFYLILIVVSCFTFKRIHVLFSLLNEEVLNLYNEVKTASFWQKSFVIFLLFYFFVLLFINLIHSLGPEIGTDPIVYRLFPLRIYADNHALTNIPEVQSTFLPKNVEMYFLFGYMLHNEITVKVINFIFGIILCYLIYSFADRHFGWLSGLSASVLFYSIPVVSFHMHTIMVDIGLTFFLFLSLYFVVDWVCSNGGRKSLFLSALFCAFAVGIKPYAIISAASLCVLIFWKLFRMDKCSGTISFLKAAAYGAISATGYLPWALINLHYTKNPFYPFLSKYFGGPFVLEQSIGAMRDYKLAVPYLPSVGITSTPIIFFKALWGINFDGNNYDGIIGPFFILLIPILAFVGTKRLDAAIKQILWFTLINFVLWFPFIYSARFMIPLYPALCVATVYILQSFLTTTSQHKLSPLSRGEVGVFFRSFIGTFFKFLTILIVIIFAILNLPFFYNVWQYNPKKYVSPLYGFPASYVLGLESKEEYLEHFIRSYPVIQFANNLPNVKTIFYIGGHAVPNFYLKHKTVNLSTYYITKLLQLDDLEVLLKLLGFWGVRHVEQLDNLETLLKALKEHGISHIIVEKDMGWTIPMIRRTDGVFVNMYLRKIYEKNAVVLYEVLDGKKSFANEYVHYYFLEHTVDATILMPSREQSKIEDYKGVFEINGDKRFVLKILPPSKVQFPSCFPNNASLTFSIGKLFPDVGDGGTFTLDLIDQYGKTHNIFKKTLNPRDNYMDAGWHYCEVDLSKFSGQIVDFIFGSDSSDSVDEIGDWFAWADPQIVVRPKILNLIERFPEATITPPSFEDTPTGKPAFPFPFERRGDTRNTITTAAPSEISFSVNIPSGKPSLVFGLAMPYTLGDGALAEILLEVDGKIECLYSRYIYPAPVDKQQDAGWLDEAIDLERFAGKKGKLIFRPSPGAAGDNTADWIGWSEPRIVIIE